MNAHLKELLSDEVPAKDFRTWHGTVHAATALAQLPVQTKTARRRAIAEAMRRVAEHLGNTPTIARASYVDDRVIDLYLDDKTIRTALTRIPESQNRQTAVEKKRSSGYCGATDALSFLQRH